MTAPADASPLDVLRARYAAARAADRGAAGARQRHLDAACALVVGLVDELEEAAADRLLATLAPLLARDATVEIATRRALARELTRLRDPVRALVQLRAAHLRALGDPALAAEVAGELTVALAAAGATDELPVPTDAETLAAAVARTSDPERAAELERALARLARGDQAVAHARKSLAHARETVEPEVIAAAISHLCALLVERDELAEAKALLEERPPTRDSRVDRALYDEIRRRQGAHVPDPPDEPDEPAQLDPAVAAYLTRPTHLARAIIEGGLPGTAKLQAWASGTLREVADLDSQRIFGPVRSFWCACGRFRGREYAGLCCARCGVELVHASQRRIRVGCIVLAQPVLHPWHAATAGVLLDATAADVAALAPEVLRARLRALDLAALAQRFKDEIVTAPRARIADEAGRRLALVEAFRHAAGAFGTAPASLVLDAVVVAPPEAELRGDRARVRAAYAAILTAPDDPATVPRLFAALAG